MQTGKARLLHFSIVLTDLFETIDIWNTPSKHLLNYHSRFFFKVWHTPLLPGFPKTLVFTLWNFPLTSSGFNEFFLEKPILNLLFFHFRMFDSQNNNRGGYNVGSLYYYPGSIMNIEWTNQHSCGEANANCELVLQYMCSPTLRDGTVTKWVILITCFLKSLGNL